MKKFLSVFLSLVMLVLLAVPAFAETTCDCGNNPILIVTGISEFTLVDADGNSIFPMDTKTIATTVAKCILPLTKLIATKDTSAFADEIIPIANELLEPVACNPDGSIKHTDVKLKYEFPNSAAEYDGVIDSADALDKDILYAAINAVGADHVYVYGLDWRKDPIAVADEINDYVLRMKEQTGHDKVSIAGISMGGVMVSSYLLRYGCSDISNVTMISSAFTGVDMVAELFCKRIEVNEEGLANIIGQLASSDELKQFVQFTNLLKAAIPLFDDVVANEGDRIFDECLIPIFGYNPGIWSLMADYGYEEAKDKMLANADPSFEFLIDRYHYGVQDKVEFLLNTAKFYGVNVAIVSNYNRQMTPLTNKSQLNSDGVIETNHTSAGAICANLGQTLGADYVQAVPAKRNYVSSDNVIDASTCMLPDNTWFVKNMDHVGFNIEGNNNDLYTFLMTAKTQPTIDTNERFPQFNLYNPDSANLRPLDSILGDVNHDGVLNLVDARLVLRHSMKFIRLDGYGKALADFDESKKISMDDSQAMVQSIAGV